MKFAPATTATSASQLFLDRAGRRFTALRVAVGFRWHAACAAFVERYAFEGRALALAPAGEPRTVLLCGFLFPRSGGRPIPLYEGHFALDARDGAPVLRFPVTGAPAPTALRVERDFVELVDGDGPPRRYHGNDAMLVGTGAYWVKLVDPACRIPVQVFVDEEGALR
jgi:hypothetical protein